MGKDKELLKEKPKECEPSTSAAPVEELSDSMETSNEPSTSEPLVEVQGNPPSTEPSTSQPVPVEVEVAVAVPVAVENAPLVQNAVSSEPPDEEPEDVPFEIRVRRQIERYFKLDEDRKGFAPYANYDLSKEQFYNYVLGKRQRKVILPKVTRHGKELSLPVVEENEEQLLVMLLILKKAYWFLTDFSSKKVIDHRTLWIEVRLFQFRKMVEYMKGATGNDTELELFQGDWNLKDSTMQIAIDIMEFSWGWAKLPARTMWPNFDKLERLLKKFHLVAPEYTDRDRHLVLTDFEPYAACYLALRSSSQIIIFENDPKRIEIIKELWRSARTMCKHLGKNFGTYRIEPREALFTRERGTTLQHRTAHYFLRSITNKEVIRFAEQYTKGNSVQSMILCTFPKFFWISESRNLHVSSVHRLRTLKEAGEKSSEDDDSTSVMSENGSRAYRRKIYSRKYVNDVRNIINCNLRKMRHGYRLRKTKISADIRLLKLIRAKNEVKHRARRAERRAEAAAAAAEEAEAAAAAALQEQDPQQMELLEGVKVAVEDTETPNDSPLSSVRLKNESSPERSPDFQSPKERSTEASMECDVMDELDCGSLKFKDLKISPVPSEKVENLQCNEITSSTLAEDGFNQVTAGKESEIKETPRDSVIKRNHQINKHPEEEEEEEEEEDMILNSKPLKVAKLQEASDETKIQMDEQKDEIKKSTNKFSVDSIITAENSSSEGVARSAKRCLETLDNDPTPSKMMHQESPEVAVNYFESTPPRPEGNAEVPNDSSAGSPQASISEAPLQRRNGTASQSSDAGQLSALQKINDVIDDVIKSVSTADPMEQNEPASSDSDDSDNEDQNRPEDRPRLRPLPPTRREDPSDRAQDAAARVAELAARVVESVCRPNAGTNSNVGLPPVMPALSCAQQMLRGLENDNHLRYEASLPLSTPVGVALTGKQKNSGKSESRKRPAPSSTAQFDDEGNPIAQNPKSSKRGRPRKDIQAENQRIFDADNANLDFAASQSPEVAIGLLERMVVCKKLRKTLRDKLKFFKEKRRLQVQEQARNGMTPNAPLAVDVPQPLNLPVPLNIRDGTVPLNSPSTSASSSGSSSSASMSTESSDGASSSSSNEPSTSNSDNGNARAAGSTAFQGSISMDQFREMVRGVFPHCQFPGLSGMQTPVPPTTTRANPTPSAPTRSLVTPAPTQNGTQNANTAQLPLFRAPEPVAPAPAPAPASEIAAPVAMRSPNLNMALPPRIETPIPIRAQTPFLNMALPPRIETPIPIRAQTPFLMYPAPTPTPAQMSAQQQFVQQQIQMQDRLRAQAQAQRQAEVQTLFLAQLAQQAQLQTPVPPMNMNFLAPRHAQQPVEDRTQNVFAEPDPQPAVQRQPPPMSIYDQFILSGFNPLAFPLLARPAQPAPPQIRPTAAEQLLIQQLLNGLKPRNQ